MVIITVFLMFKKLEESLTMLSSDMENIKKTEIRFLEVKTTMTEMKTQIKTSDTKTVFLPLTPQYSCLHPGFDPSRLTLNTCLIPKVPGKYSP